MTYIGNVFRLKCKKLPHAYQCDFGDGRIEDNIKEIWIFSDIQKLESGCKSQFYHEKGGKCEIGDDRILRCSGRTGEIPKEDSEIFTKSQGVSF